MWINRSLSIITLNTDDLYFPIKRQTGWLDKKQNPFVVLWRHRASIKGWTSTHGVEGSQVQEVATLLVSDKVDHKPKCGRGKASWGCLFHSSNMSSRTELGSPGLHGRYLHQLRHLASQWHLCTLVLFSHWGFRGSNSGHQLVQKVLSSDEPLTALNF